MPVSTTVGIAQQILCCAKRSSDPLRIRGIGSFLFLLIAMSAISGMGLGLEPSTAKAALLQSTCSYGGGALAQWQGKNRYHDMTVPKLMQPPTLGDPGVDSFRPVQWLYERWHAFADWSANQPLYIRLLIGSVILALTYLLFVGTLSRLLGRRKSVFPRQRREGQRR